MRQHSIYGTKLPTGEGPADEFVAHRLASIANRTTRRSFLANVGRASIALLGAGFITIWTEESAYAACGANNGPWPYSDRATCMCTETRSDGANACANCCSGFWQACVIADNNPARCWVNCHLNPPAQQNYVVNLYDCCAQCSSSGTTNKAGCSDFGDDYCAHEGYCPHGCGTSNQGWRVKCVVKDCTNIKCGNIITNCN
jgi:hypothetical protein